jgi:hypothetical protein
VLQSRQKFAYPCQGGTCRPCHRRLISTCPGYCGPGFLLQ